MQWPSASLGHVSMAFGVRTLRPFVVGILTLSVGRRMDGFLPGRHIQVE